MEEVAGPHRHGWTTGATALAVVALFNVSAGSANLLSTRSTGFELDEYRLVLMVAPLVATVVGLWTSRHWPWLLVVGTALKLPEVIWTHTSLLGDRPGITYVVWAVGAAATALIVIGALCAAGLLASTTSAGRGAALAGGVIGVLLTGSVLPGLRWLTVPERLPVLHFGLAGLGVLGGVLAVHGVRTGRVPRTDRAPVGSRAAVVGSAAALLPVVLAEIGQLLIRVTSVPVFAAGGTGAAVLLCAAGLAAALGRGALLRTMTAGFVLFAVAAPLTLAIYCSAGQLARIWPPALVGLVVGVLVGHTRQRVLLAASACAAIGVMMATAGEVTASHAGVAPSEPLVLPTALLIALAVAAVTATGATVAPFLLDRRALAVGLGPLLIVVVLASRDLLQVFAPYSTFTSLPESSRTPLWAALLGVATVMLLVVGALDRWTPTTAADQPTGTGEVPLRGDAPTPPAPA